MKLFENLFSKNKDILIQSITYGLNLFIPTFVLIISSLFENYELTAELGILIGINIIFTQIFSSNARSLVISQKTDIPLQSFIFFRILISFFILFLNFIVINYYNFIYINLLSQLSLLIILQWLNELILTHFEINKKNKEIYFYLFLKLIFLFLIIVNFIFLQKLVLTFIIFNSFFFLFFLRFFLKINKKTLYKVNVSKLLKNSLSSLSFFSSFSISFANLLWRIFIIIFCGKIVAGIYFAGFAIGSLPGTFFNNTFGPSIIRQNYDFEKIKKILIIIFSITMFCFFFYILSIYKNIFIENFDTQLICTFFSLVGSIFMLKGLYFRQYLIQKTRYQSQVFKIDILYSILIVLIVPILFLIGDYKLIILSFLISSIICNITYVLTYRIFSKK